MRQIEVQKEMLLMLMMLVETNQHLAKTILKKTDYKKLIKSHENILEVFKSKIE
jgi:hypothetical protein